MLVEIRRKITIDITSNNVGKKALSRLLESTQLRLGSFIRKKKEFKLFEKDYMLS